MVSWIKLRPLAWVIKTVNGACKSVGKPGYSWVWISVPRKKLGLVAM